MISDKGHKTGDQSATHNVLKATHSDRFTKVKEYLWDHSIFNSLWAFISSADQLMDHFLDNLSGKQTIFPHKANRLISHKPSEMKTDGVLIPAKLMKHSEEVVHVNCFRNLCHWRGNLPLYLLFYKHPLWIKSLRT